MELIKDILESLEVLGDKRVRVVISSTLEVEGETVGRKHSLATLSPGDDISSYNPKVQAVCKEAWGKVDPHKKLLTELDIFPEGELPELEPKPKAKSTKKAK